MTNRSPDTSDTNNETSGVPADTLLADLMQTRMLPGEDPAVFQRLSERIIAYVQPRGGIEQLLVCDYLHYSWEALRLRRYKDNLLQLRAREGIVPILAPLLEDETDGAEYMASEWALGSATAAENLKSVLAGAGLTMDAPMAHTLAINIDLFERFDWMLEGAERHRTSALRELEHQRDELAKRAKQAVLEIEEADYRVLRDLGPVDGDARWDAMSTSAKVAVNRANARRSTGPRTAAGRARSARNAVRHGLSMAVSSDPELYAAALALTQRLTEDGGPVELASVIAEATVEIWRVRRRRHEFILDAVERGGGTPPAQRLKQLAHLKRHINTLPMGLLEKLLADLTQGHRNPDESVAEREVRVVAELAPELRRLERYERRALSRRKFAMRAFAAARGGRGPGDDVKPADKTR